jgi:ATP dependent DNA ligase domain
VRAQQARKVMRVGFFGPGLTASSTIAPYQTFLAQLRELVGLSKLELYINDIRVRSFILTGAPDFLVRAAQRLSTYAAIIDGELVVEGADGRADFNELERELGKRDGSERLIFYAFDLLYLDTIDLRGAALLGRKEALAQLLHQSAPDDQFSYSEHTLGDSIARANRLRSGRLPECSTL